MLDPLQRGGPKPLMKKMNTELLLSTFKYVHEQKHKHMLLQRISVLLIDVISPQLRPVVNNRAIVISSPAPTLVTVKYCQTHKCGSILRYFTAAVVGAGEDSSSLMQRRFSVEGYERNTRSFVFQAAVLLLLQVGFRSQ